MADIPNEKEGDELADSVSLELGGQELLYFENYNVHSAIIQQPAAFTTELSAGSRLSRYIIEKFPPGTPFTLKMAGLPQFSGKLDGFSASGPSGSTSVTMRGRDNLAALLRNDVDAEQSFTNVTYGDIVRKAMDACGLKDVPLVASNGENRKIRSGVHVVAVRETAKGKQIVRSGNGTDLKHVVTAKLGESWLEFAMRHLKKQGLFLWSSYDGSLILASPTKNQPPVFHFVRGRDEDRPRCNVIDAKWVNDTTMRVSEAVIYARGLGRKHGHTKVHSGFVDDEMQAYGIQARRVHRDTNVTSEEQAEYYARRSIAEINRGAWKLEYTLSGHAAPTLLGGWAVPIPDTLAKVEDDELGIFDDLYIESVNFTSPPRRTIVTMMRKQDLVFEDEAAESAAKAKAKQKAIEPKRLKRPLDEDGLEDIDILGLRYGTYGKVWKKDKNDP